MTYKKAAAKSAASMDDSPPASAGRQHLARRMAGQNRGRQKIWRLNISKRLRPASPASRFARRIAKTLGLPTQKNISLYGDFKFEIRTGWLVAVVGPSGSGKSTLIDEIARKVPSAIRLRADELAKSSLCPLEFANHLSSHHNQRRQSLTQVDGKMLHEWLKILSCCGLAEAPLLVRPAECMSAGQLHRLAVAAAIFEAAARTKPSLILADEFASTLDSATAQILCRQVRKLTSQLDLAIVLATPRSELLDFLRPDRVIVKPLDEPPRLVRSARRKANNSNPANWPIVNGDIRDYRELAEFHYLAGPPALHKRVYSIRVPRRLRQWGLPKTAAVLVVSPPVACCHGRNLASGGRFVPIGSKPRRKQILAGLNRHIECISRVIVHPIFRSAGLAVRLIRHAIRRAQTPLIESLAAMGRIHPMFVKAGMTSVGICKGTGRFYNYYLAHRPAGPTVLDWLARKETKSHI